VTDVTACGACGNAIAWSKPGLALVVAAILALAWLFIRYFRDTADEGKRKALLISVIYVGIGSGLVIAARTRYQWGETISIRHTLQYVPFALAILAIAVSMLSRWPAKLGLLLLAALGYFHLAYALSGEAAPRESFYPDLQAAYRAGNGHLCEAEENTYRVSNWAYVFRIQCQARVRQIEPVNIAHEEMRKLLAADDGYSSIPAAIEDILEKSAGRPVRVGFFPGRFGFEPGDFPVSEADQQRLAESGWTIIRNGPEGLLIAR
jgi:hypothetical protein